MTATTDPQAVAADFRMFVGGEWVPSVTGRTFESRNPADRRDLIGRFQAGDAADVARAIRAAEDAFPAWRMPPAPRRGEVPYRSGALLAERKGELARAMTREMGKVLQEVTSPDIDVISFTGRSAA